MSKERILRINEFIKQELGNILSKEIDFLEGVVVTITRVDTLPNLQEARVYVSVIPDEFSREVLSKLKRKRSWLQNLFNKRAHMKPIPKLVFLEEKRTREAARIEELLEQIRKNH